MMHGAARGLGHGLCVGRHVGAFQDDRADLRMRTDQVAGGADHILGREPLPPSNLEPWINPNWRQSQR